MTREMPSWLTALAERFGSRRSALVAGVAAAVLVASGLTAVLVTDRGRSLAEGEARLRPEGSVEVSVQGAGYRPVDGDVIVRTGDRVKIDPRKVGTAIVEFGDGVAAEMRPGSEIRIGSDDDAVLRLDRGDLLVQVAGDTAVVDGGSADISISTGAVKLRRSASLVAGVYEGQALISGAGQSLTVPRYRQAAVVGLGRLPGGVRPLTLDEADEWDRTFLGAVIEIDHRLVQKGRGFEALLPSTTAPTPSFFRAILPALGAAPLTPGHLEGRSTGENLIGLLLVSLGEGEFEARYDAVFGFRDAGARWGLVAADRGYDFPRTVDALQSAIDRAPLDVVVPSSGAAAPTGPGGGTTTSPNPGPSGGGGGGGGGGSGGGSATTTTTTPPTGPTTPTTTPSSCALPLGDLCVVR